MTKFLFTNTNRTNDTNYSYLTRKSQKTQKSILSDDNHCHDCFANSKGLNLIEES